ncbi:hypothetical protein [Pseudomonas amygdali]|uniref:hypothetical protein n=1 Tax=Pseudomonas amygdali TaxID=47877 RepID=UPI0004927EFB|nr:hypothetical protein [Pseudomonas amygdali]KEZ29297.1 hypothetical protein A3SK_0100090 [Pseudomonas amygdali pv. tabaci str. 6605]
MTVDLSEEEMRRALFGTSASAPAASEKPPTPEAIKPTPEKPAARKLSSPKLRVTLKVSKVFEGDEEIFSYDASTLSSLLAEQEARSAAKKKRFKYIELISVVPV